MKQIIYRMEHPQYGGPFSRDTFGLSDFIGFRLDWLEHQDTLPTPIEEGLSEWDMEGCVCACESFEQLMEWFGPFMDELSQHGWEVKTYLAEVKYALSSQLIVFKDSMEPIEQENAA